MLCATALSLFNQGSVGHNRRVGQLNLGVPGRLESSRALSKLTVGLGGVSDNLHVAVLYSLLSGFNLCVVPPDSGILFDCSIELDLLDAVRLNSCSDFGLDAGGQDGDQ